MRPIGIFVKPAQRPMKCYCHHSSKLCGQTGCVLWEAMGHVLLVLGGKASESCVGLEPLTTLLGVVYRQRRRARE